MAEGTPDTDKLDVFISYSRDDLTFAEQLDVLLDVAGFKPVRDVHGIHGAEDWKEALGALIRGADAVVFVLSPSSAISKICAWEVSEAVALGKRIIPVVPRPLGGVAAPPGLAALNYIYFYPEEKKPESGWRKGAGELIDALKTDHVWLREHTRLLNRAIEWDVDGRKANRLLSGPDIEAAKAWEKERKKDAPALTGLYLEFIKASEAWAKEQEDTRQRQLEERERLLRDKEDLQKREAGEREAREVAQREAAESAKREAAQARRTARRTMVGLVAALVLATAAGGAMLYARQQTALAVAAKVAAEESRTQAEKAEAHAIDEAEKARAAEKEVRVANARLSAKMKLNVALLDKNRIEISENWYRLATTNAASIVAVSGEKQGKSIIAGTGFLVRGKDLYPPWGDELLVVTAQLIVEPFATAERRPERYWISQPNPDHEMRVAVGEILWRSDTRGSGPSIFDSINIAILRMEAPLGESVVAVRIPDTYDFEKWPRFSIASTVFRAAAEADHTISLLSIGYVGGRDLTFAISRSLGRNTYGGTITKVYYSHATGPGSSGTPVFDADTGVLIAVHQAGFKDQWASGVPITTVREAIQRSFKGLPLFPNPENDSSGQSSPEPKPVTEPAATTPAATELPGSASSGPQP